MIIYLIRNLKNSMGYVGQTTDTLDGRWQGHLYEANRRSSRLYLHKAIRKYGQENFSREILATASSVAELNHLERLWILTLGTHIKDKGYNMTYGGDAFPLTPEAKLKQVEGIKQAWTKDRKIEQSKTMLGNKRNEGIPSSEKKKGKQSAAWTPERRAAQAARMAGNNINLGRVQSAEEIEKRASFHKGRVRAVETGSRISASLKGRQLRGTGFSQSEETKRLISERAKEQWAKRKSEGKTGRLDT